MNIERTPDGIPVINLTHEDLNAPPSATFFAALDQVVAKAHEFMGAQAHAAFVDPAGIIPTDSGLYIIDQPSHHGIDGWWVDSAVFRLSRSGYWTIDERPITVDEIAALLRPRGLDLVPLVPRTDADL